MDAPHVDRLAKRLARRHAGREDRMAQQELRRLNQTIWDDSTNERPDRKPISDYKVSIARNLAPLWETTKKMVQMAMTGIVLIVVCILMVLFFAAVFQSASQDSLNQGCDGPCASRQDRLDSIRDDPGYSE